MKHHLARIFWICVVILSFSSVVFAKEKVIQRVEVTDIDAPFENSSSLDVTGTLPDDADYRIYDIAWTSYDASGTLLYEVWITIKPNIGYVFSGEVEAFVNEKEATSWEIKYKDELVISYVFTEKPKETISSSTLKHRIISYYDTEAGTIIPDNYRVRDGISKTFQIVPKEGYRIKDVRIDGESIGPVSEYTFKKVKEGHTIRAYFEKVETSSEMKPLLKLLVEWIHSLKL